MKIDAANLEFRQREMVTATILFPSTEYCQEQAQSCI